MPGVGTLIDMSGIIAGGATALAFGRLFSEQMKNMMMTVCGISVFVIGITGIMQGMLTVSGGTVSVNGERTADMSEKALTEYRRHHLGYVFQAYNLIPNLTVRENIEVGAYLSKNPLGIDDLMETLGIADQKNKLPNQLSGGQQQRTSIGRAIVKNPDILLCDEPTGALDYNTSKEILKLIEDVNKKYGNTVIMVTHNDAIKNMADRVFKLRDGVIRKSYFNEVKISASDLDW